MRITFDLSIYSYSQFPVRPCKQDTSTVMTNNNSCLLDTTVGLLQQGRAWVAKVPAGFEPGDDLDAPTASRLILYEDDRELGPSHALHETIRQIGGGAYSHWNDTLYFSTSDGSDPRTNRRTYRVAVRPLKVIVIALDGVDPQTMRRQIADGRLPVITKILEKSREVEVRTECELFGVSCWAGLASGLSVGSHGIHAFRPVRPGTLQLVESKEFRMPPPFWEMAARAGISTCVLDMPHYAPPIATSEIESLRYVEWGPHPPQRLQSSLPPDLSARLISRHGLHPCPIDIESLPNPQDAADHLACLCAGARKRAAVINDLLRMTNPELFVAVFSEPHTAGHQWLHQETPGHPCYNAALDGAIGSPVRQVYDAMDEAIGKVIEQLPAGTTVVLICLGGVRVTYGACYLLHDLLVRLGYSVYPTYPPPVRDDDDRSWRAALRRCRDIWFGKRSLERSPQLLFDWSQTRAFALPWSYEGYLRLNQRQREPYGIVSEGTNASRSSSRSKRPCARCGLPAPTSQPLKPSYAPKNSLQVHPPTSSRT